MNAPTTRVVVTDANVLINFMHVGRLSLCADLPNLEFVVPDHVRQEISRAGQRADEADAAKRKLETKRFKMPFRSFRERLRPSSATDHTEDVHR